MPLPGSLVTGDAALDAQHDEIFRRLDAYRDAVVTGRIDAAFLRGYVHSLIGYLVKHFRYEERLMAEIGFPSREAHRQQHLALWRGAMDLVTDCESDGYGAVATQRVSTYLAFMQCEHIERHDLALARCLRWRNFGEPDPS